MSLSVTNLVGMCPTCDRTPNITQRTKERLMCPIKRFVRSPPRAPSCFAPAVTCAARAGRPLAHARCVNHVLFSRAQPAWCLTSGGRFRWGLQQRLSGKMSVFSRLRNGIPPSRDDCQVRKGGRGAWEHELRSTRSSAMGGSTRGPGALEGDDVLGQVRAGTWRWPEAMSQAASISEACGFLSTSLPMSD